MSNPPPYVPSFSFSGFQETNPTDPPPGPMIDNELDNIADSLNTTITALASVRRSDGALVNGIVTPESLSSDLLIGVQTPTAWVTAHAYTAGNLVVQANKFYLCLVTHTSGVFATDLAAVKWTEVTLSITGYSADQVTYDHTVSGLVAVNVKTAIDELDERMDTVATVNVTLTGVQTLTNKTLATPTAVTAINLLTGALFGLTLSNNAVDAVNDIDIAAGWCRNSTDVDNMVAAALTKRLDAAWAVGTGQGGRMSAAAIADVTYFIFVIKRPDTGVVDVGFDVSPTAPTLPASYTLFRRIGAIVRTGGVIKPFLQDGDMFWWASPVRDINVTNPGTAAVLHTLTVPTSIKVIAEIVVNTGGGGACAHLALFTSPDMADSVPSVTNYNHSGFTVANQINSNRLAVRTDTSRRIRGRISASTASDQYDIVTNGWTDTRGRIA